MSYLVLARKYRPQTFEDVVDQNAVSQTLLNAIASGRVAHAYVFSGPRGVGKTTTARILAKCLNCEKGPTKIPCNKCDACVSISESNSTDDVLEIDGASNRGIEQIRELRESAKYAPARSRYRIYIIDEAHQITKDAFGALLKTLEEPPAHVVFMMATTEAQKIPAPILSRCQRFSLRPISAQNVFKHLKSICGKEKIKVDDQAVADIVRFVEGSMRDALSLLDQAIVYAPDGISSNTVRDLLGLLPIDFVRGFAQTVKAGEPVPILQAVNGAVQDGIDLTQLGKDLQAYYHNLLLAKAGVEDAFKVDSETLAKAAADFDFQTLERNIRLLSRALDDMRRSETPRAIFEIYALRLGQKTVDAKILLERLERLEKAGPLPAAPLAQPTKTPISSPQRGEVRSGVKTEAIAPVPPHPQPQGSPQRSPVSHDTVLASWSAFVMDVAKIRGSLATALEQASLQSFGERLTLTFDKTFNYDMVNRSMEIIKLEFLKKFGEWIPIDMKLEKPAAPAPSAVPVAAMNEMRRPSPTSVQSIADDHFEEVAPDKVAPDIQKALKHFPGTVKRERKPE